MKVLLDTHFLLWAFIDTGKIEKRLLDVLISEQNEVYYSQVSLWEISLKYGIGKLELKGLRPEDFYEEVSNSFLECLKIKNDDLVSFCRFPRDHKDPFDRMLMWQAINADMYFLSYDKDIEIYKKFGLNTVQ